MSRYQVHSQGTSDSSWARETKGRYNGTEEDCEGARPRKRNRDLILKSGSDVEERRQDDSENDAIS